MSLFGDTPTIIHIQKVEKQTNNRKKEQNFCFVNIQFAIQDTQDSFAALFSIPNTTLQWQLDHALQMDTYFSKHILYRMFCYNLNISKVFVFEDNPKTLVLQFSVPWKLFTFSGEPGTEKDMDCWDQTSPFLAKHTDFYEHANWYGKATCFIISFQSTFSKELFLNHVKAKIRTAKIEERFHPCIVGPYVAHYTIQTIASTITDLKTVFLIQALVEHRIWDECNFTDELFLLIKKIHPRTIQLALKILLEKGERDFCPCASLQQLLQQNSILANITQSNYSQLKEDPTRLYLHSNLKLQEDTELIQTLKVIVTPSRVIPVNIDYDISNRVMRRYKHCSIRFVRILFLDETMERLKPNASSIRGVLERIKQILNNGIDIATMRCELIIFSSNQLRNNSAWFFGRTEKLNAKMIQQSIGDLSDIKCISKYCSRMGQGFSATKPSIRLGEYDFVVDADVIISNNSKKYNFSDGVGRITVEAAKEINRLLLLKDEEVSGYQIRFKGYKGMLFIDPKLQSPKVAFRKSMAKFESDDNVLEICDVTSYKPGYLNRQMITILSGLGIPDSVFETLQDDMVRDLDAILVNPKVAIALCKKEEEKWKLVIQLLKNDILCKDDPFVMGMLQTLRFNAYSMLKQKSRILVPQAANLFGGLDETKTLEYGQVFVKTTPHGVIKGPVVVSRSPLFHPGDCRVLQAVDVPALYHLSNAVIFPAKGVRPHPMELSGGDLDGDMFFVSWDPRLCKFHNQKPMNYESPEERKVDKITKELISSFYADYMENDTVGMIAIAHTSLADKYGIFDKKCLELAELHSIAIDYAKTGIKAIVLSHLKPKEVPDFMESKSKRKVYESKKVLGKMYRKLTIPDSVKLMQIKTLKYKLLNHPLFVLPGHETYLQEASELCKDYNFELSNLMSGLNIFNEFELFSELITSKPPESGLFFDTKDFQSKISNLMTAMKQKYSQFLKWNKDTREFNLSESEVVKKASAFYIASYTIALEAEEKSQNRVLITFGYLGMEYLLTNRNVKVEKGNKNRV